MSQKSFVQRIKITRRGRVLRRAMALGHARANKRPVQILRKQKQRTLSISKKVVRKYS